MMFRPKNTFILITSLLLFTCSCANMLSEENKIDFLRREIRQTVNESLNTEATTHTDKYISWNSSRPMNHICDKDDEIRNALTVLVTSRYATDLSFDELITILEAEMGYSISHVIYPKTDTDHIIVGTELSSCIYSPHHRSLHTFYLLDRTGQMQQFARGTLLDDWTFQDGEALFLNTGNRPAGTTPLALYRIYNDGTELKVSELVFDPEAHYASKSKIAFDENGKRFTVYIPSYGTWQPPCEYTAEFKEKYKVAIDWDVTLSYTFDDGKFTLEGREYGDLTMVPHEHTTDERYFHTISEWQQFCVGGTLRPVLP